MPLEKTNISVKRNFSARFILIGGFLGAGKTTCMMALTDWLQRGGLCCGLITNDQGRGLVDTLTAEVNSSRPESGSGNASTARIVREITGGCFCCRSDELVTVLRDLENALHPDVFLAEPVGSCTDLVATVLLPLEEVYHAGLKLAPMSVVLDGKRVWSQYFSSSRSCGGFSKDVRYIYLKQMEEAEILVVNKSDLLMSKELSRLLKRLRRDFPAAKVLSVSARTGDGMEDWFRLLLDDESSPERVMDVDYARYGVGEALLGWYNARLQWDGIKNGVLRMDSNMVLVEIARKIQKRLERQGVEIAHFKMSLKTQAGVELTVVNAVRNGSPAEVSSRMTKPVTMGEILINLRAEGAPELLEAAVRREIEGLPVTWLESVAFRPGQPRPVHRISARANT